MARRDPLSPVPGESGLVQRVRTRLRAGPTTSPRSVVVGFSGGVDSLALAAVLARRGWATVTAVHVDHGLRPESGAEQVAAAELADALRLPFRGVRLGPDMRERHPGHGLEEAARRERFLALARVARDEAAEIIALGHHAGDQAETVLLHLFRGASLRGAGGMREWSERPIPWWTDEDGAPRFWVWRPFLTESKATLRAFTLGLGLRSFEDPSNRSTDYTRNRIRHEILPPIHEVFPRADDAIGRFADLAADDADLLDSMAVETLRRAVTGDGRLDVARLLNEHRAMQRRLVRKWLVLRLGGGTEVGQDRVDAVRRLATAATAGKTIEIGSHSVVSIVDGELVCTVRGRVVT